MLLNIFKANEELEVIRAKIKMLDSKSKKELVNQSMKSFNKSVLAVGRPNVIYDEEEGLNTQLVVMKRLMYHNVEKVRIAVAFFKNSNLLPLKMEKIMNTLDQLVQMMKQSTNKTSHTDEFALSTSSTNTTIKESPKTYKKSDHELSFS